MLITPIANRKMPGKTDHTSSDSGDSENPVLVRNLLLRDLRFFIELRLRKALSTYKVIYIVTIACGRRRRQEADLCNDDFSAVPALASLPIIPGTRPKGALNIEQ